MYRQSPLLSLSFHQLFSYHRGPPIGRLHLALAACFDHYFFPMYRLLGHLRIGRPDSSVLRLLPLSVASRWPGRRWGLKGLTCGTPFLGFMKRPSNSSHLTFAFVSAAKDLNHLRALGCSPFSERSLRRPPFQTLSKAAFRSIAAMRVSFFSLRLSMAFCTVFMCTCSVMRPGWKPDCSGGILLVSATYLFNLSVISASRVFEVQLSSETGL